MDRSKRAFWEGVAATRSAQPVPPPARPSSEDISGYEACAEALAQSLDRRPPEALVLGVTRGIVSMNWPTGSALSAIDWSPGMIRKVWPDGDLGHHATPVIADWRQMPLRGASCDLVLGDGCYASLNSFADCIAVTAEVGRVLRPGGRFVQRFFLRPDAAESVDALFEDLLAGRIPAFEQFRWRLAMALHPAREAVVTGDIWQNWRERIADPRMLCASLGWTERDTAVIDRWKGQDARLPLPTLGELREMTAERFELLECRVPHYAMGRQFPILVLRARR